MEAEQAKMTVWNSDIRLKFRPPCCMCHGQKRQASSCFVVA